MNNKQLLSLLLLCAVLMAQAQSIRTYMFNFHKNDFTVETLNGDTCLLSSTRYNLSLIKNNFEVQSDAEFILDVEP
jgi:hypothetical protein